MTDWYTVEGDTPEEAGEAQQRLLAAWPDAPLGNLEVCAMLLEVAKRQVIVYAPAPAPIEDGQPEPDPPGEYVYAQLQQAINLWNAGRVASDGTLGVEGFSFTPRPLDKTIQNIIRPRDVRPDVY